MDQVQARVNPDGYVAQRMTYDTTDPDCPTAPWVLTSWTTNGITIDLLTDEQVDTWPVLTLVG